MPLSNGRVRINMASLISGRTDLSAALERGLTLRVVDNRETCQHISSGSSRFEQLPIFSQIMQVSVPYVETEHPLRCIIKMTNATYLTKHARCISGVYLCVWRDRIRKRLVKTTKWGRKTKRDSWRHDYISTSIIAQALIRLQGFLLWAVTFWTLRLKRWSSNGCFISDLISIIYAALGGETKLSTLSFAG